MNMKSMLKGIWLLLFIIALVQMNVLAQEGQTKQKDKSNSKVIDDLSVELTANLNLAKSQEDRIKNILSDFQNELAGTSGLNTAKEKDISPSVEPTNKAKQDKTEVKGQNNQDVSSNNDANVNTGTAKTKNETNDNNMTGRSDHAAVSFERARIDADSRIEELLTPEQAIQYGKIKSDWWDKVREKIQPGSIKK